MNQWETKFLPLFRADIHGNADEARAGLKPIFDHYLGEGASGTSRLVRPHVQNPPEYAPGKEMVKGIDTSAAGR